MPDVRYEKKWKGWRLCRWYYLFPGMGQAMGPIPLEKPGTIRDARCWAREWFNKTLRDSGKPEVKRLPRGFRCWPADGHGSVG